MHGIVFHELKEFIKKRLGISSWEDIRKEAGVETTLYVPVQSYPDSELVALVTKIAEHLGTTSPAILEEFGKFFIPGFMRTRSYLFDPKWRLLDVLEHADSIVKQVWTKPVAGSPPGTVTVTRDAPDQVTLRYQSKRKLCAFVRGLIKGVAKHYRTQIEISEPRCMLRGQAECEFIIRVVASGDGQASPPPATSDKTAP